MKNDLDFAMEVFKNETLIEFKGVLREENLSAVREKLFSSVEGINKIYFIDVENVKFRDKNYLVKSDASLDDVVGCIRKQLG